MHEMSIAQNIITILKDEKSKNEFKKPVKSITLITGRMNAVIPDSLKFCFDIIKKDIDFLQNSILEIKEEVIKIRCNSCNSEKEIEEPIFLCDNCNSSDIEILSGTDMYIESIDIED